MLFTYLDIPKVLLVIFLEILLSTDNAIVIARLATNLPKNLQKKALWSGYALSFVFRAISILIAIYLIQFYWIQFLGALYLLYLAFSTSKPRSPLAKTSFWKTVLLIEMTDLIFAVDSILAAIAVVGISYPIHHLPPNIWIIYVGGIIGIATVRFGTTTVIKYIDKYPQLQRLSSYLIALVGLKLLVHSILIFLHINFHMSTENASKSLEMIFWIGTVILISYNVLSYGKKKR